MLMSSSYKKARKEGEPEAPAVEFVATVHAVDKEQAAKDKATMEAEVEAACTRASQRSPSPILDTSTEELIPPTSSSPTTQVLGADVLTLAFPSPTPGIPGVVTEGVTPLREVVDVEALPATTESPASALPPKGSTRAPSKKRVGALVVNEPIKKRRATAAEKGKGKAQDATRVISYAPDEINPRCLNEGYTPLVPPVLPGFHLTNSESLVEMKKIAEVMDIPDEDDVSPRNHGCSSS